MALVQFITLGIIIFVMIIPVFTVAGYMSLEDEPRRHEISSKLTPLIFLILAIINFSDDNYIQMVAALVVAFLLFFVFRNTYDQDERLDGKYVQAFLYLTAIYFALGVDINNITTGVIITNLTIAVMISSVSYFLPLILRELAPVGGNYNAPSLSGPGGRDLYDSENIREVSEESIQVVKEGNRSLGGSREENTVINHPTQSSDNMASPQRVTPSIIPTPPATSPRNTTAEDIPTPELKQNIPSTNTQESQPSVDNQVIAKAPVKPQATQKSSYRPNDIFEIVGGTVQQSDLEPSYNPNALDEDTNDPQLNLLKELSDKNKSQPSQIKSKIEIPELPKFRTDQQAAIELDIDKTEMKTKQPKAPTSGFKFHLNKEEDN